MRKFHYLLGAGLLVCAGLLFSNALLNGADDTKKAAEPKKTDTKEAPREKVDAGYKSVEEIALANKLLNYGRAHKSAEAVLLAVQIMAKNPTAEGKEKPKSEDKDNKGEAKIPSLRDFVAEAKAMPSGNTPQAKAMLKAAESALEETGRSPAGGARHYHGHVGPKCNWNYHVKCRGGEWTNACLNGFSGADLDLYIYDPFGNLVTSDTSVAPEAHCSWYVPQFGVYRIRVYNYSPHRGSGYVLNIN